MAKPNYSFEKRQRELVKKKKKEEKNQRKLANGPASEDVGTGSSHGASAPSDTGGSSENS